MNNVQITVAEQIKAISIQKGHYPNTTFDTSINALCVNTRRWDESLGQRVGEIYHVMPNGWVRVLEHPQHEVWSGPPYKLVGQQLVAVEGYETSTPQTRGI